MKIMYYPLWRKQYFFNEEATLNSDIRCIYSPYSLLSKIIWSIWKRSKIVRNSFVASAEDLPINLKFLHARIEGFEKCDWALNTGTAINEKKYTGLLYNKETGKVTFLKYAESDAGKKMLSNEIAVMQNLKQYSISPKLIKYCESGDASFFLTEAVAGNKVVNIKLTQKVFSLLLNINKCLPIKNKEHINVFSHGDFCPWNLLENTGEIKAIDWERAGYYPLGYDLFTYVFQTNFILNTKVKIDDLLAANTDFIAAYFDQFKVKNWKMYLHKYSYLKMEEFKNRREKKNFNDLLKL